MTACRCSDCALLWPCESLIGTLCSGCARDRYREHYRERTRRAEAQARAGPAIVVGLIEYVMQQDPLFDLDSTRMDEEVLSFDALEASEREDVIVCPCCWRGWRLGGATRQEFKERAGWGRRDGISICARCLTR